MNIGSWIRRRGQKWHLVESLVAEDAITRCGRRMDRVTRSGGELQVSAVMPLTREIGQPQLCKAGCDRQASDEASAIAAGALDRGSEADYIDLPRPEDDGSTAPNEDTP